MAILEPILKPILLSSVNLLSVLSDMLEVGRSDASIAMVLNRLSFS
jgi:hypothetical protein